MTMLLYLPMIIVFVGAVVIWFQEAGIGWKITVTVIVLASLAIQWIPALQVHFVIPVVIQSLLACCLIIYWKFAGYTQRF
jgi:hypothetical protein